MKPGVQCKEEQALKDPEVPRDADLSGCLSPAPTPSSSEQVLEPEPEPRVTFLLTLLSTEELAEPRVPDTDLEMEVSGLLAEADWGPQQTADEFGDLQDQCRRLWDSAYANLEGNLALEEKLQSLSGSLCKCLKEEVAAVQQEVAATQQEVAAVQREMEAIQKEVGAVQEEMKAFLEEMNEYPEKENAPREEPGVRGGGESEAPAGEVGHVPGTEAAMWELMVGLGCLLEPLSRAPSPAATQPPESSTVHPTT